MFSRWSDSSKIQFLYLVENSKTCNSLSITLKYSNSEKFGSYTRMRKYDYHMLLSQI